MVNLLRRETKMVRSPQSLLGGPVFRSELGPASRRPWAWVLRYVYLGWLVCQFLSVFSETPPQAQQNHYSVLAKDVPPNALKAVHRIRVAQKYLTLFFPQQLALLLLAAPAIAGGA